MKRGAAGPVRTWPVEAIEASVGTRGGGRSRWARMERASRRQPGHRARARAAGAGSAEVYRSSLPGRAGLARKNGFRAGGHGHQRRHRLGPHGLHRCRRSRRRTESIRVSMPSRYSSEGTKSDARETAEQAGRALLRDPHRGSVRSYLESLRPLSGSTAPGVTEQNIQARIRGNLLMALSNKFGWLVLTTGNKSEMAVGYATLYGDMAGGFAVLKDVPKTLVYRLADYRNSLGSGSGPIPASTIERAPSAELAADQTDQDTLPPYDILDRIIEAYVVSDDSVGRDRGFGHRSGGGAASAGHDRRQRVQTAAGCSGSPHHPEGLREGPAPAHHATVYRGSEPAGVGHAAVQSPRARERVSDYS